MPIFTREALQKFAPRPTNRGVAQRNWDAYVDCLIQHGDKLCQDAAIDTALELQHFMAQIGWECQGLTLLWESGAYTTPERLFEIFGEGHHSAKMTMAECRRFIAMRGEERDKAIFERAYGLGNPKKAAELGNTEPGDGYRYRGYGPQQITGKRDHHRYLNGDPSVLAAMRSAFLEWEKKGLNEFANRDDIKTITKRINGGYNGFEGRKKMLARAKRVWPRFPTSVPVAVPTTAQIVEVSTKAQTAKTVMTVVKTGATIAAVTEAAEPIADMTKSIEGINAFTAALSTMAVFVKQHALLAMIVLCIVVYFFMGDIIKRIIGDYMRNGYMPSGGDVKQPEPDVIIPDEPDPATPAEGVAA